MEGTCISCQEVITNFTSINTIGEHIAMWLPAELAEEFRGFHSVLTKIFYRHYHTEDVAIEREQPICLHCYIGEVYHWLQRHDPPTAGRFLEIFSFGYTRDSFDHETPSPPEPDAFARPKTQFGICDECGEYAEKLVFVAGEWLCGVCERYG
ncbi:MAG: hypothetical protein HY369_02365 [Candidatus Aenigmarchaeota archaeon]|nr:hypothetical protein [Candidatus Aenigmarchaeota archaeon]